MSQCTVGNWLALVMGFVFFCILSRLAWNTFRTISRQHKEMMDLIGRQHKAAMDRINGSK